MLMPAQRTEQHVSTVLSMPSLALDLDIESRALQETCRLSD